MFGLSAAAIAAIGVGVAAVGVGVTAYQGNMQAKTQNSATNRARELANKQATAAEQANNAANQKRPNVSGILDAASQAGRAGVSGTMLTGSQGVDKNAMALGRNALLGQ